MSELSSRQEPMGTREGYKQTYASGGIEFHNQMRAFDQYHKEMQSRIEMFTRKIEAKEKNTEKFKEVRKKELERELDFLEESLAKTRIENERKLKLANDKVNINEHRKAAILSRKDLINDKLKFMRDLHQFDPRWKDKLRAKKQMELNRLEQRKTQIQTYADGVDQELDHQIKDTKYDIYQLQKYSEIRETLLRERQKENDANLFKALHGGDQREHPAKEVTIGGKQEYEDEYSEEEEEEEESKKLPPKRDTRHKTHKYPKEEHKDPVIKDEDKEDSSPSKNFLEERRESNRSEDDLLRRLEEKKLKRQESYNKRKQDREEKEKQAELERQDKFKKDKLAREKQRIKEQEEKAQKLRLEAEEKERKRKQEEKEREEKRKALEDKLREENQRKEDMLKAKKEAEKAKAEKAKAEKAKADKAKADKAKADKAKADKEKAEKAKNDNKDNQQMNYQRKSLMKSSRTQSRPSYGKTIEDEGDSEDEDETEDNFGGFQGSFRQGQKLKRVTPRSTPKVKHKYGKLSSLLQRARDIFNERNTKKPKPKQVKVTKKKIVAGKYGELSRILQRARIELEKKDQNDPQRVNEIEVAGIDSSLQTSFYEEGEGSEVTEGEIPELFEYIRRTEPAKKNSIVKNLFNFIDTFKEFESGNLFNFDIYISQLYSEIYDGGDTWQRNSKTAHVENCMKLLVCIMLSEKESNFSQVKFTSDSGKFSKSQNCTLPEITKYMTSPYAKDLFTKIYIRLIDDGYLNFDQNTKLNLCRNLSRCLVDEKFEHLVTKIIMKCLEQDAKNRSKHFGKIEIDDQDLEKPSKKEESKKKSKNAKQMVRTKEGRKGLVIIQQATDAERYKYSQILVKFIEENMTKAKSKNKLYNLDECDDPSMSEKICEHVYEINLKNKAGKTLSVEVACGLLMQLLRTRGNENIHPDDLDEDNNNITSEEIRRLIQDKGCANLYELIYDHMLNAIEAKKSTISYCSRYLSEALLNFPNAAPQDKKYIENSIASSMKREINKRELNKSSNAREMMNKQFSPQNSDEDNPGVVMGMKKKKKNKGPEININDFGFDATDHQAIEVEDEYLDDFESFSDP
ncbi:unnamed protein product [Moneuplotes crassus]|uniref:Uncharacterized protein n=2 Tax=Euplotes crassus TaxID=5936 RepID=A0AAD1XQL1_EUPCR|nr:unnamed protein product [Moneuplotes crassus]